MNGEITKINEIVDFSSPLGWLTLLLVVVGLWKCLLDIFPGIREVSHRVVSFIYIYVFFKSLLIFLSFLHPSSFYCSLSYFIFSTSFSSYISYIMFSELCQLWLHTVCWLLLWVKRKDSFHSSDFLCIYWNIECYFFPWAG